MMYTVKNPRRIPQGVRIIYWPRTGQEWYEGDEFVPPEGMDITRLLREGYIEANG